MPKNTRSLKEIRSAYAKLKKAGVVKPLDSRKIKKGKGLAAITRQINKYEAILRGEAKAVPVRSKTLAKDLKAAGYETVKAKGKRKNPVVIVPKTPEQKVKIDKFGKAHSVSLDSPNYNAIVVPVKGQNLKAYLESISQYDLPEDSLVSFRYFGYNSRTFRTIEQAIEFLSEGRYENFLNALNNPRSKDATEIYRNLEFIQIKDKPRAISDYKQAGREYVDSRRKARKAENQKKHRERMNAEAQAKYKAAAKQRAAKSRKKNKG